MIRYQNAQPTNIELVRALRNYYFPNRLEVGDCITVAILVGAILQSHYSKRIELVNGKLNYCYHTWLSVEGEQIDPCLDCTLEADFMDPVCSAVTAGYAATEKTVLDTADYCPGLTLKEIVKTFSHQEINHEQYTT